MAPWSGSSGSSGSRGDAPDRPAPRGGRREPALDPGLQSERTSMAWQRTALGVGGVGALLLHSGPAVAAAAGACGLVAALTLLVVTEQRYERIIERVEGGDPPSSPRLMAAVTVTVGLLALGALALVAVSG